MSVSLPPIQIPDFSRDGRSGPNTQTDTGAGHHWLFEYLTPERLYVVTWSFIDPNTSDPPKLRVYKSTNGGASWAVQDEANSPAMSGSCFDVLKDGNLLRVVYQASSSHLLRINAFNVATDTWGAASVDGPDPTVGFDEIAFKMVKVASGDIWVFFNYSTDLFGSREGSKYTVFSAGAWAAPVIFTAEAFNSVKPFTKLIYDSGTNLIHVISLSTPGNVAPTTWTLLHQTVTVGGTISAPDTIGTIGLSPNGVTPAPCPNVGRSVIWNGFIVVPVTYFRTPLPASNRQVIVFMGTPVAAPVWTPVLINTVALPANEQDYEAFAFAVNGTLFVFWVFMNGLAGTVEKLYWSSTTDGTTWTAPVLHYDAIADPIPSPSPSGNYIHGISAMQLDSGLFGASCAMQSGDGSDCLGFYLIDGASALAVDCNSPPSGTVGHAYTHSFLASGGTPPYTFAITVGTLPTGLTLDTATGIISGIPTVAAVFPFTVQVTDSLAATATVDCSITIVPAPAMLPTIICDNPPVGIVGTFYTHDFPASGGTPPYTFALEAGMFPPGLILDANTGNISGVPTINGIFTFTIQVTDSGALTAQVECSITIKKRCLLVEVD